jgi:hypothetical protein
LVLPNLGLSEFGVGLWREISGAKGAAVPKAAMDEDGKLGSGKDDIG